MTNKFSLATILDDLLRRATNAPGIPARQMLKNGLRVDVLVLVYETGESETFLQLRRETVYPSTQEWLTVLKNWPTPRDPNTPYRKIRMNGCYLKGSWLIPPEPVAGRTPSALPLSPQACPEARGGGEGRGEGHPAGEGNNQETP